MYPPSPLTGGFHPNFHETSLFLCIKLVDLPKTLCERRDSNSHGLPHWNLNPARLPIPPRSRKGALQINQRRVMGFYLIGWKLPGEGRIFWWAV